MTVISPFRMRGTIVSDEVDIERCLAIHFRPLSPNFFQIVFPTQTTILIVVYDVANTMSDTRKIGQHVKLALADYRRRMLKISYCARPLTSVKRAVCRTLVCGVKHVYVSQMGKCMRRKRYSRVNIGAPGNIDGRKDTFKVGDVRNLKPEHLKTFREMNSSLDH